MNTNFSLFILFALAGLCVCSAPVVKTSYGLIQGVEDELSYMYLGIPFAKPPIGNFRWKNPVDIEPWKDVLNASSFQPACPQVNCSTRMPEKSCPPSFSEDCLYLNVFVPKNLTEPKPVMLFIHGGNFQYQGASSIIFDGRTFTNISDCIFVTIQYRLGALGFLVTGLETQQANGNFGILDQRMAIKWVKQNIQAFNGNPDKITLFGQSAGGESVTIHLLSEDMQENFNNVIIQSSPMSIPFKNFEESILLYNYFNQELQCAPRDMACLRSKSIGDILDAQVKAENKVASFKLLEFFEAWLPWIDGKIIKGQLLEFDKWITSPNFEIKPFIIGTLTEECYIYINLGFPKPVGLTEYGELLTAAFKKNTLKVLTQYPPSFSTQDQRDLLSVMATNWVFSCSSRRFLEKAFNYTRNKNEKFYYYVFDFALDFPGWDNFTFCNDHVCHGSDMPYTFDSTQSYFTSDGIRLSRSHVKYWSNFAKYNQPGSVDNLEWTDYSLDYKTFLRFKTKFNTIESDYLRKECDFFDSIGYYY